MHRRTRAVVASVLALSCQAFLVPALSADAAVSRVADSFDTFFRDHVASEHITGAAYAVATSAGIVRIGTAGFTDTTRTQRIDDNTVFRVASVSKTFAAGLTAVLVEEGRFAWDDRVVDYVPDFHIKGDSSRVRIEHLLGQSTGLIPHAFDNLIEDGMPLDQIETRFRELSYICQPGSCYSYQNSIFSLIGPVIEKTTAQSYAEALEQRIFDPLDMQTASVGYEPLVSSANYAKPHVQVSGNWKTVPVKPNYYEVAPAAGVNASVLDMGKWLVAQMGGQPAVIDPTVIETLTRPRVETRRDTYRKYWRDLVSQAHYGLGWRIYRMGSHDIAYHSGWVSGYRADIAWSAEHGIGIVVLMNVEGSSINEFTTTFWRLALEQIPSRPGGVQSIAAALKPASP